MVNQMTIGIAQLISRGPQDAHLMSDGSSLFVPHWRKHTPFGREMIQFTFGTEVDFGKRLVCTATRGGDLMHRTFLSFRLPEVHVPAGSRFRWLDHVGHAMVEGLDLEIGKTRIDRHTGEWLHVWSSMTCPAGNREQLAKMIGMRPELSDVTSGGSEGRVVPAASIYVPLEFWFCRELSEALPVVALQYHDVRFVVDVRPLEDCCWHDGPVSFGRLEAAVLAEMIFLDNPERKRFAQQGHRYLIEQMYSVKQDVGDRAGEQSVPLDLWQPCKELAVTVQRNVYVGPEAGAFLGRQTFNYTSDWDRTRTGAQVTYSLGGLESPLLLLGQRANPIRNMRMQVAGKDMFPQMTDEFYTVLQPYMHHASPPPAGVCVYSFGLDPESIAPSGSLNMSKTQTIVKMDISPDLGPCTARVYGLCYNVLDIRDGMAGVLFTNC
jgi:hypothetical protein